MPRSKKATEAHIKHTGKDFAESVGPYDPPVMAEFSDSDCNAYEISWSRNELDMRTKSFVSMAIAATLGTEDQFKTHVRAAHHIGITKEEIVGLLFHFKAYLGSPRTSVARRLAREVWKEMANKG